MATINTPAAKGQQQAAFSRKYDPALIAAVADQYLDASGEVWQHVMVPEGSEEAVEARSAARKAAIRAASRTEPRGVREHETVAPVRIVGVEITAKTSPGRLAVLSGMALLISLFVSLVLFCLGR